MVSGNAGQEFAQRLDALLESTGLQAQQIVRQVMDRRPQGASWKVTRVVISAWRRGRNLPSRLNEDGFWMVVRVATEQARRRAAAGHPIGELWNEARWADLLERARAVLPAGRHPPDDEALGRPVKGAIRQ